MRKYPYRHLVHEDWKCEGKIFISAKLDGACILYVTQPSSDIVAFCQLACLSSWFLKSATKFQEYSWKYRSWIHRPLSALELIIFSITLLNVPQSSHITVILHSVAKQYFTLETEWICKVHKPIGVGARVFTSTGIRVMATTPRREREKERGWKFHVSAMEDSPRDFLYFKWPSNESAVRPKIT